MASARHKAKLTIRRWLGRALSVANAERLSSFSALEHEFRAALTHAQDCPGREPLWEALVRRIGADTPVTYVEFGVHRGESMRFFAGRFTNADSRFIGCDSFEGLPTAWGTMPPGSFSTGGEVPEIADDRIAWIKGLFHESRPRITEAIANALPLTEHRLMVNFDADLYESTLLALAIIDQLVDEYSFIMDEFWAGEVLALSQFARSFGWSPRIDLAAMAAGDLRRGIPVHVAGKLTRVGEPAR